MPPRPPESYIYQPTETELQISGLENCSLHQTISDTEIKVLESLTEIYQSSILHTY